MPAHNAHLRTHAPCAPGAQVPFTSLRQGGKRPVLTRTLAHNLNCAGVSAAPVSLKVGAARRPPGRPTLIMVGALDCTVPRTRIKRGNPLSPQSPCSVGRQRGSLKDQRETRPHDGFITRQQWNPEQAIQLS